MRKILFILVVLPMAIFAQTSIAGIDFGSSYSKAERALENKFGEKEYLLSDKTELVFKNKMYAGMTWSSLLFLFQSDIIKYDSGGYGTRLDYGPYDYVKEEL